MTDHPVSAAVIPVAGLGTRFLPATKVVPKELLPVVDRPAIQLVVEEAARAGICDVVLVTSDTKPAVAQHFAPAPELERGLREKGDDGRAEKVSGTSGAAGVRSVLQPAPLGLGHAVLCAAEAVGNQSFAVLLPDDLIDERDTLLPTMMAVHQQTGQAVIALMEMPESQIGGYGCAALGASAPVACDLPGYLVTGLVEKPQPHTAPSNLAVIGRYILPGHIFQILRATTPGRGGEIQLTDALATLASTAPAEGGGVIGLVFHGRRYDTGNPLDYLKTQVQLGCTEPVWGQDFAAWLREFVE